jgi:hypothetical protein
VKVNPIYGSEKGSGAKRRRQVAPRTGPSFGEVLGNAANQRESELEMLFNEIDEAGDKLKDNPNLNHFHAYRERVARFIRLFLSQAYVVKLTSEMTLAGRQRYLVLVKKIDEKLETLYQLFVQELLDIEDLLKGVEEVRGMLLDLYR